MGRDAAKAADAALLELQETCRVLDAFVENSTDAIQISDRNLVTIRVNRAYEVLTGINREELVGVPVAELVQKHLISESCGAIVAQTGEPHTIVQTFYRTGRSAHVSCKPVRDENGEIEFFICNDRDLDEISRLQSQLTEVQALNDRYLAELDAIRAQNPQKGNLVVQDREMLKVLALAARVAKVDSTVLILGETGVGKDELARFIHANSHRSGQKFVSINCGAITESLFESELFGHEGHAFTGAGSKVKPGLFEMADGGTIFLDEIGELSLNMQTRLLHVLQSHTFLRVGGSSPVTTDVRVITATNRDLLEMTRQKKFREDLYYRLNVVPIHIPPLRERKNDIIPLAQSFLAHYNEKYGFHKKFSPTACFVLLNNAWEGNVRQLKNAVEQAVIMTDGDVIQPELLPGDRQIPQPTGFSGEDLDLTELLERTELRYLNLYYEQYGNIRDAARHLQMSPATFQRRRKQFTEKYEPEALP
ncbi:MAG: sigma 54-interacting transcriptional regulator [Oscillospiraceae bacterium]|nr:sigma 54-interacting transcriptional regulator [Oscillospiraceae bacterium]